MSSLPADLPRRLADTLAELIPKSESDLAAFQRLVQDPCEEFETRMTGYGFETYQHSQQLLQAAAAAVGSSDDLNSSTLSVDGNDTGGADSSASSTGSSLVGSSLLAILASLRSRFAKSKRREILLRAREVVLSDYHNTMLAAGDALEVSIALYIYIYTYKHT